MMDENILKSLVLVAVPLLFAMSVVGIICAIAGIAINGSRILANTKRETSLWRNGFGNPFNIILRSDYLTDAGQAYQKRLIFWIIIAVAAGLCGLASRFLMTVFA